MPQQKSRNSSSSGPTANGTRYTSLKRSNQPSQASFQECHPDQLAGALDFVTSVGDLISFCRTSDGGALCIRIGSGNEVLKLYAVTQVELDDYLTELANST